MTTTDEVKKPKKPLTAKQAAKAILMTDQEKNWIAREIGEVGERGKRGRRTREQKQWIEQQREEEIDPAYLLTDDSLPPERPADGLMITLPDVLQQLPDGSQPRLTLNIGTATLDRELVLHLARVMQPGATVTIAQGEGARG